MRILLSEAVTDRRVVRAIQQATQHITLSIWLRRLIRHHHIDRKLIIIHLIHSHYPDVGTTSKILSVITDRNIVAAPTLAAEVDSGTLHRLQVPDLVRLKVEVTGPIGITTVGQLIRPPSGYWLVLMR